VTREFGGSSKGSEKKLSNRKLLKSIINIIIKNDIMIRILATELLNIILLLVFIDRLSPLKLMVDLDNFNALFGVPWVEKG
jgi:hypothetical protein